MCGRSFGWLFVGGLGVCRGNFLNWIGFVVNVVGDLEVWVVGVFWICLVLKLFRGDV